ncbi:MAG: sensor histidine kinase [Armatimonadota bacterium]
MLIFAFFWATFPHVRHRVTDPDLLFSVLIAGLLYLALRASVVLRRWISSRWEPVWVSLDLALVTALVRLSGGINSEAGLMYLLPILTYSIQRRVMGTMAVGGGSVLLYVLATLPSDPSLDYIGRLTTRVVVLVLVTVIATCYALYETNRVNELARLRARVALGEYRHELSAEIHDGIQHYLVSMAMRLEMVKRIAQTDPERAVQIAVDQRVLLRQAADELRYLIRRLRAPALEHRGFVEAIREHVKMFSDCNSMTASMELEGRPAWLSPDADHAAFRIVQESLMNAEKHSEATEVTVRLRFLSDSLECTIADNGVGFDTSQIRGEGGLDGGFGLSTMKQRAEQAGGKLQVESAPGEGTCVRFLAPTSQPATPPGDRGRGGD